MLNQPLLLLNLVIGGSSMVIFVFDPLLYCSIVGALQHIIITRIEISYVVNRVCQITPNPFGVNWLVAKAILKYLKGTIDDGLSFSKAQDSHLVTFL